MSDYATAKPTKTQLNSEGLVSICHKTKGKQKPIYNLSANRKTISYVDNAQKCQEDLLLLAKVKYSCTGDNKLTYT